MPKIVRKNQDIETKMQKYPFQVEEHPCFVEIYIGANLCGIFLKNAIFRYKMSEIF